MNILLVGEYKSGKTVTACTFPKPLLYIDICENGFRSVETTKGPDGKPLAGDLSQITVKALRKTRVHPLDFQTSIGGNSAPSHVLESNGLMMQLNTILREAKGYETIVFDSLTAMFLLWEEAIMCVNRISSLRIQDYGTLKALLFGRFIPTVKALPARYKILIDHTTTERDETTGRVVEYPVGPTKAQGKQLGKEFDEVWGQQHQGDKFLIRTKPFGYLTVGSRSNVPDGLTAHYSALQPFLEDGGRKEEQTTTIPSTLNKEK